jgi:hypothetical protein
MCEDDAIDETEKWDSGTMRRELYSLEQTVTVETEKA